MRHILVAVMNGTKARFLTLEGGQIPGVDGYISLVEQTGLTSPEHELQGQELWSTSKTGRNRGTSGQAHSYDDHREKHVVEYERRFAGIIAQQIAGLLQTYEPEKLILVAEPQFLGLMREAVAAALPKALEITELAKDLCQLKPLELHEYLANKALLPAPQRLSAST
jgi:protein required for attachment to host cells